MNSRLVALFVGANLVAPFLSSAQVPFANSRGDPTGNVTLLADPRLLPAGAPRPAPSPAARAAVDLNAQKFQAPGSMLTSSMLLDLSQSRGTIFQQNSAAGWKFIPDKPGSEPSAAPQSPEFDRLKAERDTVIARKRELDQQARALDTEIRRLNALLFDAVRPAPVAK